MDSAGKKVGKVKWTRRTGRHCRPVLQLPTGQSSSLQTCCTTRRQTDDPGAHGMNRGKQSKMNGASKLERGQMMRTVGMAGKEWQQAHSPQNRHCRRTQPADSPPGTGLKTNGHRWPASQQTQPQMTSARLLPCSAGRWGECYVAGTLVGGLRPT